MKVPDKIYGKVVQNVILDCSIQDNGGFEYIRKDTLLEWAKDYMKGTEHSQFDTGFRCALKTLIDKLNSM